MLYPCNTEQHGADTRQQDAGDNADGRERGKKIAAFVAHERPGARIEH